MLNIAWGFLLWMSATNAINYLKTIHDQNLIRNSLTVPDESRKIFNEGGATKNDLELILIELIDIYDDVLDDLRITGGTVNKEIIA
ncbi:hypothetical protein [Cytobacillus firmus]|uniref:hypothetical protein n=1 Tax=Cytobacillus firmus TaxID=1399 RepID=UPI0030033FAD